MMTANVAGDTQSEAALLKTLADPAALAERLRQLTEHSANASAILEQAKAESIRSEGLKKEADELHAATMELLRKQHAKEVELASREEALAAKHGEASNAIAQLATEKQNFLNTSAEIQAAHDAREEALQKAEADHADRHAQLQEAVKQELAAKSAALDAAHAARLEQVNKIEASTTAKNFAAEDRLNAANRLKSEYEQKLAALKQIVA